MKRLVAWMETVEELVLALCTAVFYGTLLLIFWGAVLVVLHAVLS